MRLVLTACIAALLFAASPATGQEKGTKGGDAKVLTISGCLSGGSPAFVISNVLAASPGGDAPRPSVLSAYALVPREGLSLSQYVGHRVELVGTVVEGKKDPGDAEAAKRKPRGPSAQFAVTSAKSISPVCIE